MKDKISKFPSELRSDPLSRDWVIIATGRGKRPGTFKKEKREKLIPPKKDCPFCHIESQEKPVLIFAKGKKIIEDVIPKDWTTCVIPNKYPALIPPEKTLKCKKERKQSLKKELAGKSNNFYQKIKGIGYHEVVVTKDHQKSLALFNTSETKEIIDVYQERYLDLMKSPFIKYISIFHNHGKEAGASIFHPHSQILATPVIDPDLNEALINSRQYFKRYKKCIYCTMNQWDLKKKERIVFENKKFLVACPFVSKTAFEIIISPKKHLSYFEKITEEEKRYLAQALQVSLKKLYKALNDPPYNFYLHTAPCDGKNYDFYHWHFTILPKTQTWAGFELCAGIEISTIEPEKAADYLRKQ